MGGGPSREQRRDMVPANAVDEERRNMLAGFVRAGVQSDRRDARAAKGKTMESQEGQRVANVCVDDLGVRVPAALFTGAWFENPQYWELLDSEPKWHTVSNRVRSLHEVHWFSIQAEFSLPPGLYFPYFRMALSRKDANVRSYHALQWMIHSRLSVKDETDVLMETDVATSTTVLSRLDPGSGAFRFDSAIYDELGRADSDTDEDSEVRSSKLFHCRPFQSFLVLPANAFRGTAGACFVVPHSPGGQLEGHRTVRLNLENTDDEYPKTGQMLVDFARVLRIRWEPELRRHSLFPAEMKRRAWWALLVGVRKGLGQDCTMCIVQQVMTL